MLDSSSVRAACAILAAALGLGCTVGPDYRRVPPQTPASWQGEIAGAPEIDAAALAEWWGTLGDPVLVEFVREARQQNRGLREAYLRIQEARAILGIAVGERLPVLDAASSVSRARTSENVLKGLPVAGVTDNRFVVGAEASWEIDLFGRIRRQIEAAHAELGAAVEHFRDIQVVLCAEVALAYVEARALQARIAHASDNHRAQEQTLQLTRDRFVAGLVPQLDVAQAEYNSASTKSAIPSLEAALQRTYHRLDVLLGVHPGTVGGRLAVVQSVPRPPLRVAVGVPADLLRRRPDIRRAEREVAAATALIGVATADLYPRFTLGGFFSLESAAGSELFENASRAWGFGPAVRWNVFAGGRVLANIAAADARAAQAVERYELGVLRALEDVENAMVDFTQERQRRDTLLVAVDAAQRSVDLVRIAYRAGIVDFQNVLDSERTLARQQDGLAVSDGAVTKALIRLFRALGGGWDPRGTNDEATHDD